MTSRIPAAEEALRVHLVELARVLNFWVHELDAYRQGTITPRQAEIVRLRTGIDKVDAMILTAIIGAEVLLAVYVVSAYQGQALDWVAILLLLAPLVLFVMTAQPVWQRQRWARQDIRQGQLVRVQGRIQLDEKRARNWRGVIARSHYIVIGDKRFRVDYRTYRTFHAGGLYAIYYTPRTRIILAAEPLLF